MNSALKSRIKHSEKNTVVGKRLKKKLKARKSVKIKKRNS